MDWCSGLQQTSCIACCGVLPAPNQCVPYLYLLPHMLRPLLVHLAAAISAQQTYTISRPGAPLIGDTSTPACKETQQTQIQLEFVRLRACMVQPVALDPKQHQQGSSLSPNGRSQQGVPHSSVESASAADDSNLMVTHVYELLPTGDSAYTDQGGSRSSWSVQQLVLHGCSDYAVSARCASLLTPLIALVIACVSSFMVFPCSEG